MLLKLPEMSSLFLMLFILPLLRPCLRPFYEVFLKTSAVSLSFLFFPSIKHVIIASLPCSSPGHAEHEQEPEVHSRPSTHYTKEGEITVFWNTMKGQHEARKAYDQEIYDVHYTGIRLPFINKEHMYLCLHSHVCTLASPRTCIHACSLMPLNFFFHQ